jgi:hypothetical protein
MQRRHVPGELSGAHSKESRSKQLVPKLFLTSDEHALPATTCLPDRISAALFIMRDVYIFAL